MTEQQEKQLNMMMDLIKHELTQGFELDGKIDFKCDKTGIHHYFDKGLPIYYDDGSREITIKIDCPTNIAVD